MENTQENKDIPPRRPMMVGIAVLMMVLSRAARKVPKSTAMVTRVRFIPKKVILSETGKHKNGP